MRPFLLIIIFSYGLLIGSFLNAWIWRTKQELKIARGRSMCPHCHTQLKWYELIPVFSWLGLLGRCRTCHKRISLQYPLVELFTAISWCAAFVAINPDTLYSSLQFVVWIVIITLMMAAFVFDLKWMLLPDKFTLPAIAVAAVWLAARWIGWGESNVALQQLIGAVLFGGFFWVLWYGSGGKWLGDGDIRLAVLMGLLLTTSQLVVAIFLSFNIGAVVGVGLIWSGLRKRRDALPFGPFLITGLFLGACFGDLLIQRYFQFFM